MSWAPFSRPAPKPVRSSTIRRTGHACAATTTQSSRGRSPATGACTMAFRKLLLPLLVLAMSQVGSAQPPTYGVGRTPTADEIHAWDISIGPDGKELPP